MIWTILGISVAIVAVFCVSVAETLVGKPVFENHREYMAGALVLSGACAWFIGRYLGRKGHGSLSEGSRRFLLGDFRYWGPMFMILGIITLFIQPLKKVKNEAVSRPVAAAAAASPQPEPPPKPKAPVSFPQLKMQGVFFRDDRPFAIINGDSYTVGDHLGEVIVKAIDRTSVVIELSGEEKLLTLN